MMLYLSHLYSLTFPFLYFPVSTIKIYFLKELTLIEGVSVHQLGCNVNSSVVIAHCVLFSCSAKWSKTGGVEDLVLLFA